MLTVYLIDDDVAIQESLAVLLETMGWRVETFASAGEFLAVKQQQVLKGCILCDIRMPGKTGLTLLEELRGDLLLPVILMTGHGNIESCRRAFKQGAFEFLTKPIDADMLIESISSAFSQFTKRYQQQLLQMQLKEKFAQLSARETEVMYLMVNGKSNKEIALLLGVSPRTVEAHRANLLNRLAISSLAQLVKEVEILNFLSEI